MDAPNWKAATQDSGKDDWATPRKIFDPIHKFAEFTVDACANDFNKRIDNYWDIKKDGLSQDWSTHRVWCNPPFGRSIGDWVETAAMTDWGHGFTGAIFLVPARTDTAWWHDWVMPYAEITFLRGRVKYEHPTDTSGAAAPFPSVLLYYGSLAGLKEKIERALDFRK